MFMRKSFGNTEYCYRRTISYFTATAGLVKYAAYNDNDNDNILLKNTTNVCK